MNKNNIKLKTPANL